MNPLERLVKYCKKHNYTILQLYTTNGDEVHNHKRAIVINKTGERYHLYYDRSRFKLARCANCFKPAQEHNMLGDGCAYNGYKQRGWRNVTLDNRKAKLRRASRIVIDEELSSEYQVRFHNP